MKWLVALIFLIMVETLNAQNILNEDFEGTGLPSGWANNSGTPNFDYTAAPLAGLQSLQVDNFASCYYLAPSTIAELWFKITFEMATLPSTDFGSYSIGIADSSVTQLYVIDILPAGTLKLIDQGTTHTATTVSSMSAGTIYNIWGHYHASGILEVSFDVVGNPRPTSGNKYASIATGAGTTNAQYLLFGANNFVPFVFDDVKFSSTDIFGGVTSSPSPSNRFFLFKQ